MLQSAAPSGSQPLPSCLAHPFSRLRTPGADILPNPHPPQEQPRVCRTHPGSLPVLERGGRAWLPALTVWGWPQHLRAPLDKPRGRAKVPRDPLAFLLQQLQTQCLLPMDSGPGFSPAPSLLLLRAVPGHNTCLGGGSRVTSLALAGASGCLSLQ